MSTTTVVRRAVPEEIELPGPPLLARLYAARGVRSAGELNRALDALPPPTSLKGLAAATGLLAAALAEDARVLFIADFDADGATACALGVRALRAFGARHVDYLVPDRQKHGYGLTPELVELAAERRPDLLVTVDNGIASVAGVAAAKARGMRVLVTDHHLPGDELPAADAIVNPNQPGCGFPSRCLAGVGVIFYVMLALRATLRARGWYTACGITEPNLARLLDLVAFGTVADVVALDHVNRVLVEQGLRRLRAGACVPGLAALAEVAGRPRERLCTADIGYALAPRLNAAGRIEHMSLGIECLLADDAGRALELARELDRLNRERREIEDAMKLAAFADLDALDLDGDLPFGLCLYDETWHQGVIGILAARVRERTHRPTIVFAADRDGQLKGSARSVPGLHIRDALAAVAARAPDLITRFGGHAMAAGLSLPAAHYATFRDAFDAEVRRHLAPGDLCGVLLSDGELGAGEIALELADCLREAGPWGQGFPEPLFDGVFEVAGCRVLKERHLKLLVRVPGQAAVFDAIAFGLAETVGEPRAGSRWHLAYRLDANEWNGSRKVQLRVEYLAPA
ncbi:exonuclease RecJ [Plasticicumulans lactativorans]|uniref:Single-stranded-DNA-specific exonuclease RecJ n=1 Tax=Plasticicumulans lactativorans TaxID=1133106 RepID=A0A4R2LCK1_9GAMM|nr:single-stranded-DNA-specific exonuclease RecJ [Plasticicumulans lactativorans]TCO82092.1 exonuclease RecJ [Plasticicumulans lactativorans]